MTEKEIFTRLRERYIAGDVPWDAELPPPEVITLLDDLAIGRAIDLGCGYGRASIYLASRGWDVDAIEFIPEAVAEAAQRAAQAGVKIRFHITSVLDLDFLSGPFDFALDVGCSHNLNLTELAIYRDHLSRLLRADGIFLLYGRVQDQTNHGEQDGPAAFKTTELIDLFSSFFQLEWKELGVTTMPDQSTWSSGWFCFRKKNR